MLYIYIYIYDISRLRVNTSMKVSMSVDSRIWLTGAQVGTWVAREGRGDGSRD